MRATCVGIIGYGRFGRLAARTISSKFRTTEVIVFARKRPAGVSEGVQFTSLEDVCRADVIIPCVPISAFEEVIKTISPKIKAGALVIDVCSVKVYPVKVMTEHLPASVEILATHPSFGPDSARRGLKGLKIVLHNVRVSPKRFSQVKAACENLGLETIEMTPDEHDRLMAYSLAYTHLVGRIGERMGIKHTIIDTRGFEQLMKIQSYVTNDTFTLFKDMQNFNPYAREMRQQFRQVLSEIEEELPR